MKNTLIIIFNEMHMLHNRITGQLGGMKGTKGLIIVLIAIFWSHQ